ncbi:MAG: isoprenylcysteine carboxylmethyltransferase family protein [Oleispira antarctica]|uniref:S-isoprenylcysteine methyltransferase n=1 Tax=Oleispira antarctica RB-8 TaxID=698738 RepID=R4YUJ4_OLEAN|nr:isoprenylcysteine carboxylmethyltransferase family protein [Oleispira antarctica]MBQ0791941.1 isoprenylcysteine carboxylmethyltransferase family protein [Oleispira antarctica]CCK76734.1 S-isoprenylcysteine methyltransferase [Oleispira antarctica RB-8]
MKFLQLKCPPPIVMLLSMVFSLVLSQRGLDFMQQQVADLSNLIWPLIFLIAGIGLAMLGVKEFLVQHTTLNPLDPSRSSSLVVSGVYQLTRNPMYLGMLVVLLGWGDFLDNFLAYSGALIFFVYMTAFQIKPEEAAMLEKFGESFKQYCQSVRRWL